MLVFIHDDVWIDDYFFADRIIEGLQNYDVIGVAGNQRRVQRQPAWAFVLLGNGEYAWDEGHLSGAVAHGAQPCGWVTLYGPVPRECELLDGVFLAAKKSTLTASGTLFDPRFDFHCYDLDFCRSARKCGLRLGTWPICLTHQSRGIFGTVEWFERYLAYIDKWKE
jgi:hypothetical protein